jgi:hypothetical protein
MYTHRQRLLAVCVCCVIVTTGFSGCATTTSANTTTFLGGPSFYAITSGPDGNLWFTENLINEIGEISPKTGSITEYNIPTNNAYPIDITRVQTATYGSLNNRVQKSGRYLPRQVSSPNIMFVITLPILSELLPVRTVICGSLTRMKSVKYLP